MTEHGVRPAHIAANVSRLALLVFEVWEEDRMVSWAYWLGNWLGMLKGPREEAF